MAFIAWFLLGIVIGFLLGVWGIYAYLKDEGYLEKYLRENERPNS